MLRVRNPGAKDSVWCLTADGEECSLWSVFRVHEVSMTVKASTLLDLLLAVLPAIAFTTESQCTLTELHSCLKSLQSVTQSNDLALATTRAELTSICNTLKESVLCVDDHMNVCFTMTQRKVFNHVVAGARQVLSELCVPGNIQEAYLKHAPCFKNVSVAEEKCAPKYRYLLQMSENVNEKVDVEEGLRKSCCAFGEFVLCKYSHVSQDCGKDAADFLQQHLDRISSPLIHEHCAHYTFGTDTCSFSSSLDPPRRWVFLLLVVFVLFFEMCDHRGSSVL